MTAPQKLAERYHKRAKELYADDNTEIDPNGTIALAPDGAWVVAHVGVYKHELP